MPRRHTLLSLVVTSLLYLPLGHASSEFLGGLHSRNVMLRSLREVKSGCAGLRSAADWSALGPPDSEGLLDLRKACHWVEQLYSGAETGPDLLLHTESRRLEATTTTTTTAEDDVLWFANSNGDGFPLPSMLSLCLIALVVIYLWEYQWVGTTMFTVRCGCKCCKRAQKKGGNAEEEKKKVDGQQMVVDGVKFWKVAKQMCDSHPQAESEPVDLDQGAVRFQQRAFSAHVKDGKAVIHVERVGRSDGEVKVQVKTHNRPANNLAAKAGEHYQHTELELVFRPGETLTSFEVPLLKTFCWESARWFRVELGPITAGDAMLYPQTHTRVFVIDDALYPGNVPAKLLEEVLHKEKHGKSFLLGYYFMKECASFRGEKFKKTFLAMLYQPFHNVVVVTLVQKFIISYVSKMDFYAASYNGAIWEIVMLAGLQFFSTCLWRWADVVQTKNRGRTGGIRQTHRLYLLDKLLVIGHHQAMQHKGVYWLYAAIHDVDCMTMDIYWQFFLGVQALESLILSFLLLTFWDFADIKGKGSDYDVSRLTPSITFVLLIPAASILIYRRRHETYLRLSHRKDNEAAWIHIFSWICEVIPFLYGYGYRELGEIEAKFKSLNKDFVKEHQLARDTMNDSVAIAVWFSTVSYLIILIWGGFGLLAQNANNNQQHLVEVGHYVLLLGLFKDFGKYVGKLHNCQVNFQRGSISLMRYVKFLNMPDRAQGVATSLDPQSQTGVPQDCITLRSACLHVTETKPHGLGPFGSVFTKQGCEIRFPLGKIVMVKTHHEARALSILGMVAGTLQPTSGDVLCPGYVWRQMLTTHPVHTWGDNTALGELLATGSKATPEQLRYLLMVFGLDPDHGSRHLPPGQVQLLVFLRALLRDPEVLVMSRPFAFITPAFQSKAGRLLEVWQRCGGADGLLKLCGDQSQPEETCELCEHAKQRTIIIAAHHARCHLHCDEEILLDQYFEENPPGMDEAMDSGQSYHAMSMALRQAYTTHDFSEDTIQFTL